ncbi:MAG TPA: hypothetical protein DDY52_05400 [Candidatus Moranbacteria bacterium]|nr:hypothetical protein [Candidatus Moranbacteria bacterium]
MYGNGSQEYLNVLIGEFIKFKLKKGYKQRTLRSLLNKIIVILNRIKDNNNRGSFSGRVFFLLAL